jgi:hypothetical protein
MNYMWCVLRRRHHISLLGQILKFIKRLGR